MSRPKGFTVCDSAVPEATMAPALQILIKEHAKLRRDAEAVWVFAAKAWTRTRSQMEQWYFRQQKFRVVWNLHAIKEEQILTSTLSRYMDTNRGPLAVMYYEHELMESMLDKLEEDMLELIEEPDNQRLFQEVSAQFRQVCQVLSDHCFKEEKRIFMLAQSLLTDDEKRLILQLMRKMKR